LKIICNKNLGDFAWQCLFKDNIKGTIHEEIIDKEDFIKMLCSTKDNFKRKRRLATVWEKNLQKTHLIKDYYGKSTKNS
jgi:hypothetical protein